MKVHTTLIFTLYSIKWLSGKVLTKLNLLANDKHFSLINWRTKYYDKNSYNIDPEVLLKEKPFDKCYFYVNYSLTESTVNRMLDGNIYPG